MLKDDLKKIPGLEGFAEPDGLKKGRPVTMQEWQETFFSSEQGRRVLGDLVIKMCRFGLMPMPADLADIGRRAVGIEILENLGVLTEANFENDTIVAGLEAIATGSSEWFKGV